MSKKLYSIMALALLLAVALLAACQTSGPAQAPTKVTVKFNWAHEAEWAGFYAAQKQGYYADENLEVTLLPGETDPIDEVVSGENDFGAATGTGLVLARAEGKPVTAVAAVMRQSPLAVMTMADAGITRPQDLVGKTVEVASPNLDAGWDIQFLAMLKEAGVDARQINLVPVEEYGIGPLVRGDVDAIGFAWSASEGVAAGLEGYKTNLMFMSEYNVLEHPVVLFTSEKMIEEKPDMVERFVRATLKGQRYAVEHPDEAAVLATEWDDTLDRQWLKAGMAAYVPLIDTGDAPIGWMDAEVWQSTQDVLQGQGFISSPVDPNTLYTDDFVQKAQG